MIPKRELTWEYINYLEERLLFLNYYEIVRAIQET